MPRAYEAVKLDHIMHINVPGKLKINSISMQWTVLGIPNLSNSREEFLVVL